MSTGYYNSLSAQLFSLQSALPSGLEGDEKEAVLRKMNTMQGWIRCQIQEILEDEARHAGLQTNR